MLARTYPLAPGMLTARIVRVASVSARPGGRPQALVSDLRTRGEFNIPMSSPHRILPQVGDIWIVSADNGIWGFRSMVSPAPFQPARNLEEVIQILTDLGLVEWDPRAASSEAAIATAHGAYVGEIRLFRGTIPTGWFPCDGGLMSRIRYADLFREIGTTEGAGDGVTTFKRPTIANVGSAVYCICAF